MALCACGTNPQSLQNRLGTPALAVDLSALDTCRGFLKPVALADVKAGDVADDAVAKGDAATMAANGRISAADRCVASVQQRYAGGGKKG